MALQCLLRAAILKLRRQLVGRWLIRVLLLQCPVSFLLYLHLVKSIYFLLSSLTRLFIFFKRTHLNGLLLLVFLLAVVSAVGATVLPAELSIRFSAHIEGRLRNFEDHFVRGYRKIANLDSSLDFRLLVHQSHVLSLVELSVLLARLPQRYMDSTSCFGSTLACRRNVSYLIRLQLLLRIFVKLEQVLVDLQCLLDLRLFTSFLFCNMLFLLVLHELANSFFFQHWTTYHTLMSFIESFLLFGHSRDLASSSSGSFEDWTLQIVLLDVIVIIVIVCFGDQCLPLGFR